MKITTAKVQSLALPAGKSEIIYFDDEIPGFGLRIREGGSRTLVFQYKLGDKQRRLSLGKAVDVARARETAKDLQAKVRLGGDPAGDKAESRARAGETFRVAAGLFLEHQKARLRPRSYPDVERHLLKHAKALHGMPLAKVAKRDIATCIAAVAQNRGMVTANRVRSSLSSLFAWAMQQGLVEANPVFGTTRNEERSRARVLSPGELRLIWNALSDDHYGAIMRLLALTAQRAGEIAGLRWAEIDLEHNMIRLPGERTKNARPHSIPLSQAAQAIIKAQPRRTVVDGKPRELVFGFGKGGFSGWSYPKRQLDARIAKAAGNALPAWTPHDLRRTAATIMADKLGVQPHIIEAILNHVSGHRSGVHGTYNRATYETEKRTALNLWAECLIAVVEGRESNVTPLRKIG